MSENIISQIGKTISTNIDLKLCQKEALQNIALSMNEINILLNNEKVREKLVKNELKLTKNSKNNDLLNYSLSIEKNIKKLTLFLEILKNKERVLVFDTKRYFESLKEIDLSEPISHL
ncbi:MAG: hypothetical protein WBF48_01295 [Halarcobacter sp.]